MTPFDWKDVYAAVWRSNPGRLRPILQIDPVALADLLGIEEHISRLKKNTERFLAGQGANNALLWGARGTGKSSLIKAIFNHYRQAGLRLIEVDRDDLIQLAEIVDAIRDQDYRFIVFCDDLSFDAEERHYKALKHVLEGSVELPPRNVLIYATSNRRHLVPDYHHDNLAARQVNGEIHPGESVEEKIALADRFGLCLSFYPVPQPTYLGMIDRLFADFSGDRRRLHILANRFAIERGSRSGRVAKQFYNQYDPADLADVSLDTEQ
ncbi:MAG: ATP-binding protein [Gammaproteobacteria bacterium]|nr:ATP-binding protein [Gammaproteobacteria bacterium]